MIVTRTPLRVSLFGGGTDLPEFYEEFGGAVLSFSINKYIYVTANPSFDERIRLAYSDVEQVKDIKDIQNPIIRESLIASKCEKFLEITTIADVPSHGTGLASSSAFTVGLLNTLSVINSTPETQVNLAEKAFEIERFHVGDPVGKQDHYGTAIGGLKFLEISKSGDVYVSKLEVSSDMLKGFFSNLLLVYTGIARSSKTLLLEQQMILKTKCATAQYLDSLALAKEAHVLILKGSYDEVGQMLATAWTRKKEFYKGISNPYIDELISTGIQTGALGAKLLGAGGGGFVLFYAPSQLHREILANLPLAKHFPFKIDTLGTQIVYRETYD